MYYVTMLGVVGQRCCVRLARSRLPQTANFRFKLRISQNRKQADKSCPEQFLWIKQA